MLNESVINVLKNGMWDLATCANGESNVVPVAFKDVTEEAKSIMGKLFSLTGILEVRADDCIDALASSTDDYEDAVVKKVAHRNGMDYIVTRNIKDYQAGDTKIILPDDFVKLVEEE